MKNITIEGDYIKLEQLLKLAGAVSGGGEAKLRIQAGEAKVNGEEELRRGRKLRNGDEVSFDGEIYRVAGEGA